MEDSTKPGAMARLEDLQRRLGYRFKEPALLERALTHSSFTHELGDPSARQNVHYEALEFLGDSVLGFVVSDYVFRAFPSASEGELTRMKAYLVSRRHLAPVSQALELGAFLKISRGEEKTGGRKKKAILADLFESVVAAIYLDGGTEAARDFVTRQFGPSLEKLIDRELPLQDAKSTLQERLHSCGRSEPGYRVVRESGPAHDREFLVEVVLGEQVLARASGRTKKSAEQKAARRALEDLDSLLG